MHTGIPLRFMQCSGHAVEEGAVIAASQWSESGATCIACGIGISSPGFGAAAEQRDHFKTDWHR